MTAPAPAQAAPEEGTAAVSRLSRHSWIAGLVGATTLMTFGWLAMRRRVLDEGWGLRDGPPDRFLSFAFVLAVTAGVMLAVEIGVRVKVEGRAMISLRPGLREGDLVSFLSECVFVYLADLGLIELALVIYTWTSEYGFRQHNEYYRPWFAIAFLVQRIYLYGGLPYVIATRALQHDPAADRKHPGLVGLKAVRWLGARALGPARVTPPAPFTSYDGTAVLGLFVKIFFVPLMTVFFADQFTTLVKNYDYVLNHVVTMPSPRMATQDVYNVAMSVIFSVDVGLAWGGYVISTRWIKNTMWSVEPTLLGWTVALLCYPPFSRVPGFYFQNPGEHAFLSMRAPLLLNLFAAMSIASFTVYTASTVCFGLRFSNLTHRGIISTGPYALVRHPAYASKNFSWWCVMLPVAIMQRESLGFGVTVASIFGLVMLTGQYYLRAITEERHLSKDPEYRAYMARVPHRFIPGVL